MEAIEVLLHSGIVDTQEFVGGSHHVDTIWLAFGTFLVHELVHGLISGRLLEDYAHHKEQRPTQGGGSTLGDTATVDFHLAGLVWWGVNTRKRPLAPFWNGTGAHHRFPP